MSVYFETGRLLLRGWRDEDLAPFAAMNADARVMKHHPAHLTANKSDAFAERIQKGIDENGFGLFAVEVKASQSFIGYTGLSQAEFAAPFTPAVEIGWRLAFDASGHGYASEAATVCLAHGFSEGGLDEIVSFASVNNRRSIVVMERIGMSRCPDDDFEHPDLPAGHPLRRHVFYRIGAPIAAR